MIEIKSQVRVIAKLEAELISYPSEDYCEIPGGVRLSWSRLQPREAVLTCPGGDGGSVVHRFLLDILHPAWNEMTGDLCVKRDVKGTAEIVINNPHGHAGIVVASEDVDEFVAEVFSRPDVKDAVSGDHYLPPSQRPDMNGNRPGWFERSIGIILNAPARKPRRD